MAFARSEGAHADKALITRYFGPKEGRFAPHIVDYSPGQDLDPMIATIRSLGDSAACEQLRVGLAERFIPAVAHWIGTDGPSPAALLTAQLMGAQQRPWEASEELIGVPFPVG